MVLPIVQTTVPARTSVPSWSSTPAFVTALARVDKTNLDAAGRQSLVGIFSQLLGELGQDPIPALNDGDLEVAATQRGIEPHRFGQQVENFTGHLDAAESTAEDRERHQVPPPIGIRLNLGPFELTDEVVPQHEPVAQRLERERLRPPRRAERRR